MTTKKANKLGSLPAVDPGSLMLAVYVFAVSALVLLGWLGSAGADGKAEIVLAKTEIPAVTAQIQR